MSVFVYVYCDPRKPYGDSHLGTIFEFEPFYVGKGRRDRIKIHLTPSRTKRRLPKYAKIAKLVRLGFEIPVVVCQKCKSDEDACRWEVSYIEDIGRKDKGEGPLLNLTDGGEGCWEMSEDVKIRRFANRLGASENEVRSRLEGGKRWCSRCGTWKDVSQFNSTYCKPCSVDYNREVKRRGLLRECGGQLDVLAFYERDACLLALARKSGQSLVDYYDLRKSGNFVCVGCGRHLPRAEMVNASRCRSCRNSYHREYNRRTGKVGGVDVLVSAVSDIVGDEILAKAVVQAAKRQRLDVMEYTKQVALGNRWCPKCGKWKTKNAFWKMKKRVLGVQSRCVECWN